jgi:hypothetical protein
LFTARMARQRHQIEQDLLLQAQRLDCLSERT